MPLSFGSILGGLVTLIGTSPNILIASYRQEMTGEAFTIAFNIALSLELNPDTFLMAVAVGASCAFLTPVGHQNNALIMGPGGYEFGDYWRMGLPLEKAIVAVALPLLVIV